MFTRHLPNGKGCHPIDPDGVGLLSGVVIECRDWAEFIPRQDAQGTPYYRGPPYWVGENDYGRAMFARADSARMAELRAGIRGGFLRSLNNLPEVRAAFAAFHMTEVRTTIPPVASATAQPGRGRNC